jgi:nicotinamide-nucleotide amidase
MLARMTRTVPDDTELTRLAHEVGTALKKQGVMLATAESCTGGWVAQMVTSVAGSSEWFERGFVSYTNLAKRELLEVKAATIARQGAVSEAVARAMAEGALGKSHAQVTLAVTGIAGPSGGTPEKPVGTVWFAWAGKRRETESRRESFDGDREAVRRQAVAVALRGLLDFLKS